MPAECEIGLDPFLQCGDAGPAEPRCVAAPAQGSPARSARGRSAPERQRPAEAIGGNSRLCAVRVVDEAPEAVEVELAVSHTQHVSRRLCDEPLAELLPEAGEVVLKRRKRGRRGVAPRDAVYESVDGDDMVRVEQ